MKSYLRMKYEEANHLVKLDSVRISPHVAEESFEDSLGVYVDVGLLIGQILKEGVYEIRQIFDEVALKKESTF